MRILIGAPVRQDHTTFYRYLKALNQLKTDGFHVDFFFVLHNSTRLKRFLKPDQFIEFSSMMEYKRDEKGHHWTLGNLTDVMMMKNFLLKKVLVENYDYFFLVDSDLILKPETLHRLFSRQKDIIAEVFWTKWQQNEEEMPNAWIADHYTFLKHRQYLEWRAAGVYEVGMTGACILIHRNVLESGVDYTPIKNVSFSNWEDRAFCIRAAVHGYDIFLDTTCPPEHLYRITKPIKPTNDKQKQSHQTK